MANQNTLTDTSKGKIASFPSESLESSLQLVDKIVKTRGEQTSTVKQIAVATGIGEGTLPLPISTACQYGILENIHGSGYKPTLLYSRIKTPTFESERDGARFEALSSPALYKRILETFNGKILPNETGFANYLVTNFGFKPYAIPKIVKAFFQNFSSSIDGNSKLRFIAPLKNDELVQMVQEQEPIIERKIARQISFSERQQYFQQPIPLPGEKMIILEYPKGNMTTEDFAALKAFISFLEISEGIGKEKRE